MLREVMRMSIVKEGINCNLIEDKEKCLKVIDDVIAAVADNRVNMKLSDGELEGTIEVALYKGEETGQYLLEARLFDKEDSMVNAYLEIINKDFTIHEDYIDDVWSYDNWEVM